MPEVVDSGETGFIVRSMNEAVEAVARLSELDRGTIRRTFERRFSSRVMAERYLHIFRRLASTSGWPQLLMAAE